LYDFHVYEELEILSKDTRLTSILLRDFDFGISIIPDQVRLCAGSIENFRASNMSAYRPDEDPDAQNTRSSKAAWFLGTLRRGRNVETKVAVMRQSSIPNSTVKPIIRRLV